MILQGGVSKTGGFGGGFGAGAGGALGSVLAAGQQLAANMQPTLEKGAILANDLANSASNQMVNFNPIAGNVIQPQNVQAQPQQGISSLYNYLTR